MCAAVVNFALKSYANKIFFDVGTYLLHLNANLCLIGTSINFNVSSWKIVLNNCFVLILRKYTFKNTFLA